MHDNRLYPTPDIRIAWVGFEASAWVLQRMGWEFEEIVDHHDLWHKTVALRHRLAGWAGIATCPADQCMSFIHRQLDRRSDFAPVFVVKRMMQSADSLVFERFASVGLDVQRPTCRSLDFEPGLSERHSFTLADILPGRIEEEIIVEPETVAGLLDRIKQLQAPELARIREENRKRALRETHQAMRTMRETRHATILTVSA